MWVAFSLVVLLAALAAVVDVGRVYVAQRDLQRLADLSALDAASASNGCHGQVNLAEQVEKSLRRNGGLPTDLLSIESGTRRVMDGQQTFVAERSTAADPRYAVKVRLQRQSPARLLFGKTVSLHAQAAATAKPRFITEWISDPVLFVQGLAALTTVDVSRLSALLPNQTVVLSALFPGGVSSIESQSSREIFQQLLQSLAQNNQVDLLRALAPLEGLFGVVPVALLERLGVDERYQDLKISIQALLALLIQAEVERDTQFFTTRLDSQSLLSRLQLDSQNQPLSSVGGLVSRIAGFGLQAQLRLEPGSTSNAAVPIQVSQRGGRIEVLGLRCALGRPTEIDVRVFPPEWDVQTRDQRYTHAAMPMLVTLSTAQPRHNTPTENAQPAALAPILALLGGQQQLNLVDFAAAEPLIFAR